MQALKDVRPAPVSKHSNDLVNPLDSLFGYQLRRASQAMMVDLSERLALLDLTVVKGSILLMIESNPNITQIRIARAMSIKRANMAPLISNMEAQGLISRKRVDGRSQGLNLTESGLEAACRVMQSIRENEIRFTSRLDALFGEQMHDQLNRIWDDNLK